MSKFDELKKLAEAATQEKWELYHGNIAHDIDRDGAQIIAQRPARSGGNLQKKFDADFSFIVAANPAAILELLTIQAQMVAALSRIIDADDDQSLDGDDIEVGRAALAAAGAQP